VLDDWCLMAMSTQFTPVTFSYNTYIFASRVIKELTDVSTRILYM